MYRYEQLASEKYVVQAFKEQELRSRRLKQQKAVQDFTAFMIGLGLIAVGIWAAQQTPVWFPYVEQLLVNQGWIKA